MSGKKRPLNAVLFLVLCVSGSGGCTSAGPPTRPLTLRVVDGDTGEPLAGARLHAVGALIVMFGPGGIIERRDYGPTRSDGLIATEPLRKNLDYSLAVRREGYYATNALTKGSGGDFDITLHFPRSPAVGPSWRVVSSVGVVTVPLFRGDSPSIPRVEAEQAAASRASTRAAESK